VGKTSRKFVSVYGSPVSLSDCQYAQIVNFGYYFIITYCVVAIMYSIIIII